MNYTTQKQKKIIKYFEINPSPGCQFAMYRYSNLLFSVHGTLNMMHIHSHFIR